MKHLIHFVLAASLISFGCRNRTEEQDAALKIIGGTDAETPGYMASFISMNGDQLFCGGVFISSHVVLTAAHCVSNQSTPFAVIPGLKRNENLAQARRIPVRKTQVHSSAQIHDLALVFLQPYHAHEFPKIEPVKINDLDNFPIVTQEVTVMGFGRTGNDLANRDLDFQKATLHVVPNDDCVKSRSTEGLVTDRHLCAFEKATGGCKGDSGGPLVVKGNEGDKLVGIVAWGDMCSSPNKPGVYMRVSKYTTWITKTIDYIEKQDPLPNKTVVIRNYRPNPENSNFGEVQFNNFTNEDFTKWRFTCGADMTLYGSDDQPFLKDKKSGQWMISEAQGWGRLAPHGTLMLKMKAKDAIPIYATCSINDEKIRTIVVARAPIPGYVRPLPKLSPVRVQIVQNVPEQKVGNISYKNLLIIRNDSEDSFVNIQLKCSFGGTLISAEAEDKVRPTLQSKEVPENTSPVVYSHLWSFTEDQGYWSNVPPKGQTQFGFITPFKIEKAYAFRYGCSLNGVKTELDIAGF